MRRRPLTDPTRVEDVLQRLEVLNGDAFAEVAFQLIWIETSRQADLPVEHRSDVAVQRIVEEFRRRAEGYAHDPGVRFSAEFVAWLAEYTTVGPASDLHDFFARACGFRCAPACSL